MAFAINIQPKKNKLVSTLIPITYQCIDTDPDTTNVIAKCFYTLNGVVTQIGGSYRLAPSLIAAGYFKFDASEVFNTITKTTLQDVYPAFGADLGVLNTIKSLIDIGDFKVYAEFYREYLDTTTGLIIVDPAFKKSNDIYVHEGCPEYKFLNVVADNGTNVGAFNFFNTLNDVENTGSRYFTNYPILNNSQNERFSNVTIRRDEQYPLMYNPIPSQQNDVCSYRVNITTFGAGNVILNQHTTFLPDDFATNIYCVGFSNLVNGYTPIATEGLSPKFSLVTKYLVQFMANTGGSSCVLKSILTNFIFHVDDTCIKNSGYKRFVFKNMLGGWDCVTSNGKYTRKTKNKFEDFELSLGYNNWNKEMSFGNSNWANENVETYSVTTQVMRKDLAIHFAEMFSSTNVYVRADNNNSEKILDFEISFKEREKPFNWYPIIIKGATLNVEKSNENYATLKFNYEMAVNQRNPRY